MTTEKPTPPAGFKLVNGSELKAPFDPKLLFWNAFHERWDQSSYSDNLTSTIDGALFDDWYATPETSTPQDCPQSLLDAAKKIIEERGNDYGDIRQSFERIAKFWSAYKGVEITPKDVAAMMMLLKISRWVTSDKPDTLLDIVGYAECASKLNKAEV